MYIFMSVLRKNKVLKFCTQHPKRVNYHLQLINGNNQLYYLGYCWERSQISQKHG
jgi:hypothetical protein